MSNFRRRLILALKTPSHGWVEIMRVTTIGTTTVNLPKIYKQLGFFVVGGGGSGHGDFSGGGNSGSGGNGGCVNHFIVPFNMSSCSVTVGRGGITGQSRKNSNNGSASYVVYDGVTYQSNGGYGGSNTPGKANTKQKNSGIGGFARWGGYQNLAMYNWCANHTALEVYPGTTTTYGGKGENGLPNPFDEADTNLYGAGGGGSQNAYLPTGYVGPAISGGVRGGGSGGYGNNNTATNRGQDGSFYGAGGGGGSFSSNHSYSQGGAGYQGIIIIYGKK